MANYSEWTADQETVSVSVDGHEVEVAYYEERRGDPVLSLLGIPTDSYLWRDVIGPIANECCVIVTDMLGCDILARRERRGFQHG